MTSEAPREPELSDTPNAAEAETFVRDLVQWVGPGFHPDTDFNDYVCSGTNARSYSKVQAARLNVALDRAVAALELCEEDVYDIAAAVQHALLAGYLNEDSSII